MKDKKPGFIDAGILFLGANILIYLLYKNAGAEFFLLFELLLIGIIYQSVYNKQGRKDDEQVKAEARARFNSSTAQKMLKILYAVLFVLLINAGVWFATQNKQVRMVAFFADMVAVVGVVAIGIRLYRASQIEEEHLIQTLVKTYGFTFTKNGDMSSFQGALFGIGNSNKIENVFSGSFQGHPIRIFEYSFRKGFSKEALSFGFSLFEISLDGKFPSMVIASTTDNAVTSFKDLANDLVEKRESVTLEGDFLERFFVAVTQGRQMEVRQILTPDIMALLIDTVPSYGFLFADGKAYICFKNWYADGGGLRLFSEEVFAKDKERCETLLSKWLPTITRVS